MPERSYDEAGGRHHVWPDRAQPGRHQSCTVKIIDGLFVANWQTEFPEHEDIVRELRKPGHENRVALTEIQTGGILAPAAESP